MFVCVVPVVGPRAVPPGAPAGAAEAAEGAAVTGAAPRDHYYTAAHTTAPSYHRHLLTSL